MNEKFLYKYIMVGETDRYFFLERMLCINKLANVALLAENNILVTFGIKETVKKQDDCYLIETPFIIPGACLIFPTNGLEVEENDTEDNNIVLLESNPFRKKSNVNFLNELRKKYPQTHIIVGLMDLPRYQAYTDILPAGEDLRIAEQLYSDSCFETVILKNAEDIQKVLLSHESMFSSWKRCAYLNADRLEEKIENDDILYDFQYLWEELPPNSIRFPEILTQKICSYDSIKKGFEENGEKINFFRKTLNSLNAAKTTQYNDGKVLWECFVDCCYKMLFPANKKGGVFTFTPLYRQTIEESQIAFWNIDEDEKELIKRLEESYFKVFGKSKYAKIIAPAFKDENEYEKILADKNHALFGIRADFSKLLNIYLNKEIINTIQKMLQERSTRLRGLLS